MTSPTLTKWIPYQNLRDDVAAGGALSSLVGSVFQPVLDLMWVDAVRFGKQIDPDSADVNTVGAMLLDLGCPFVTALALPVNQQRSLVRSLLKAYKQFGTKPGLVNIVRALTGVSITAIISPAVIRGWVLGVSVLGNHQGDFFDPATTNLAVLGGSSGSAYSFQIQVASPITADQDTLIREIIRRVKPAHTHYYGVTLSTSPPPEWSLGVSLLAGNTNLG